VIGKEVGEGGTPHLQFCLTFRTGKRLSGMKKLLPRAHLEVPRFLEESRKYCKKEGNFVEIGDGSQGKRTDLELACELSKVSMLKVAEEMPVMYVKYHKGFQALRNRLASKQKEFVEMEVIVLIGKPGGGKSRMARQIDPDLYNLPEPVNGNLWFDGYDGEETILFDDFYGSWMKYHTLLQLLDGYPMQLPVKGDFTTKRWKRVILTSNKHPKEWYGREECEALMRRITRVTVV